MRSSGTGNSPRSSGSHALIDPSRRSILHVSAYHAFGSSADGDAGGGGSRGPTHVMKDQQQDHGENRLLLGCFETLDLLLGEQGSKAAEGSHSVAQCISLGRLPHIPFGGPQMAGDQAEHSMQHTYMLVRKR